MGVRNAGDAIREARLKAGLSQEQLSEGVCSSLSLSRIENNSAGVSPSTFQALMERAGASCEMLPAFASRTDFNCFYALKIARAYLDSWQLQLAYDELAKVENWEWADNKYYYQEWLFLHCKLQFCSGYSDHQQLLTILHDAITISRPKFHVTELSSMLLSVTEIELLISFSLENLYLNQIEECNTICLQLFSYISNSKMTLLEKNRLTAETAIVYIKYLLATEQYEKALQLADTNRHQMVLDAVNSTLYELYFLTALAYYHTSHPVEAFTYFARTFFASHAVGSCYATTCKKYVTEILHWSLPDSILSLENIPYVSFPLKKALSLIPLGDGSYDFFSDNVLFIGTLVKELRLEQRVSQTTLCQGLCSNSKLSKIEALTLQPDIALAEALLQRLGISERIFTFWGSEKENKLNELKFELVHSKRTNNRHISIHLKQFAELLAKDDTLYWQYYYTKKALNEKDSNRKVSLLLDALHLTLPNFDINRILDYRLSYNELSILNNIGRAYVDSSTPYKSLIYYNNLLEYMNSVPYDLFMQSTIFSITLVNFIRALYLQGLHKEVLNSKHFSRLPFMICTVNFLGSFYFFYCQSLGDCGHIKDISIYANYACGIAELVEFFNNSTALKKYLYDDFNILLH